MGVDGACSGIRSTQAVFMLALFFGELHRLCVRGRLGLLVSGLAIALLLNIVRTSILVTLAPRGAVSPYRRNGMTRRASLFCSAVSSSSGQWRPGSQRGKTLKS